MSEPSKPIAGGAPPLPPPLRGGPFAELTAPGAPAALFRGQGEGEAVRIGDPAATTEAARQAAQTLAATTGPALAGVSTLWAHLPPGKSYHQILDLLPSHPFKRIPLAKAIDTEITRQAGSDVEKRNALILPVTLRCVLQQWLMKTDFRSRLAPQLQSALASSLPSEALTENLEIVSHLLAQFMQNWEAPAIMGVLGSRENLAGMLNHKIASLAVTHLTTGVNPDVCESAQAPMFPIPWHNPALVEQLRLLPDVLMMMGLHSLERQIHWYAYFLQNLGEQLQTGHADISALRAIAQYYHQLLPITQTILPLVQSPDVDLQSTLDGVLKRLSLFAGAAKVEVALRPKAPRGPLIGEAPPHPTNTILSDQGYPKVVFISISDYEWYNWAARIELVKKYLEEFPGTQIVLSIEEHLAEKFSVAMKKRLSADERARVYFSLRPLNARQHSFAVNWVRDSVMPAVVDSRPAILVHEGFITGLPFTANALAQMMNAQLLKMPVGKEPNVLLEGGNHLFGKNIALVGISELNKLVSYDLFDKTLRDQAIRDYAQWVGKKVVFVGDVVHGQTMHHIDLYMTLLPDGTVAVSDFQAGWNWLKALSADELDQWEKEYREGLASLYHYMPPGQEDDFVLRILELAKKGKLEKFMQAWLPHFQNSIDREVAQLEAAGLRVKRIPAVPMIGPQGGLSYANAVIHEGPEGTLVMMLSSYGRTFDAVAKQAYEAAGFRGKIIFIPGMGNVATKFGGAARCMTAVFPEGDVAAAKDYLISVDDFGTRIATQTDFNQLYNAIHTSDKRREFLDDDQWKKFSDAADEGKVIELCEKHPEIRDGLLRALADPAVQKYLVPHGGHAIFISALTRKKKSPPPSGGIGGGGGGIELAQAAPLLEVDPDTPVDAGCQAISHSHSTRPRATPLPALGAGRFVPTSRSVFRVQNF